MKAFPLDPDFTKDAPLSGAFCCRCQKPLNDPFKCFRVQVDWNTWMVHKTIVGNSLIGKNCWKKITQS